MKSGNIYRYNFTHASPILCSKSLHLHLYFLGPHLYIYKWFFIFFIFYSHGYQIQHFFTSIHCANNTRPSHYHISHYIFDLTFRDYCGINLLLGHQYGSHYLYLNLKNLSTKRLSSCRFLVDFKELFLVR
jgi:hypothetical protein